MDDNASCLSKTTLSFFLLYDLPMAAVSLSKRHSITDRLLSRVTRWPSSDPHDVGVSVEKRQPFLNKKPSLTRWPLSAFPSFPCLQYRQEVWRTLGIAKQKWMGPYQPLVSPGHPLPHLSLEQLPAWGRRTSLFNLSLLYFLLFVPKHNPDAVPNIGLETWNQKLKKTNASIYLQPTLYNKLLDSKPRGIRHKVMQAEDTPSSHSALIPLGRNCLWTFLGPQFSHRQKRNYNNLIFYPS